jgi:formylmethanofuran dehydrogenase subunit C
VKPLVLTLRQAPDRRLDLSPLVPHLLVGKSAREVERIALGTTRHAVMLGDLFAVRVGDPRQLRLEGGSARFDRVGHRMAVGEIVVEGDVGIEAARAMSGGRLVIAGSTGPWAASGMTGGAVEIAGGAGERLGGPRPGEMAGMRGGIVIVRGDAGPRAGDRMRRGTIVVEGRSGPWAGSRMIAGTLILRGATGALPGYLMRRGTIVLGDAGAELSPTFADCGVHDLVAARLLAAFVRPYSGRAAAVLRGPLRRHAGDMAVLGKGELFTPAR